ncbi:SET domain [Phytophthora cactorum]|nr:SET domain [Phytophthora cactorum]
MVTNRRQVRQRQSPPRRPVRPEPSKVLRPRREKRSARQVAAAPYDHSRSAPRRRDQRTSNLRGPRDSFVLGRWPSRVAHLREQYNRWGRSFRRSRILDGNGLRESSKVLLGKNTRTNSLAVVVAEDIGAGEVLGQYLGGIEHVSASRSGRPRNRGYRLVLKTQPERPSLSIRAAINAEKIGGLMRFVNHSCAPVAKFVEVANVRRTTVVVATTEEIRRGEEVTVDYGDDRWFICRCGLEGCGHRDIQGEEDS